MNVINLPQTRNYAYCADCGEQTFFMILDDHENIIESECTSCKTSAEFDISVIEVGFIPDDEGSLIT